jgi:hypothetical protein
MELWEIPVLEVKGGIVYRHGNWVAPSCRALHGKHGYEQLAHEVKIEYCLVAAYVFKMTIPRTRLCG